jgi:hypothetical protein
MANKRFPQEFDVISAVANDHFIMVGKNSEPLAKAISFANFKNAFPSIPPPVPDIKDIPGNTINSIIDGDYRYTEASNGFTNNYRLIQVTRVGGINTKFQFRWSPTSAQAEWRVLLPGQSWGTWKTLGKDDFTDSTIITQSVFSEMLALPAQSFPVSNSPSLYFILGMPRNAPIVGGAKFGKGYFANDSKLFAAGNSVDNLIFQFNQGLVSSIMDIDGSKPSLQQTEISGFPVLYFDIALGFKETKPEISVILGQRIYFRVYLNFDKDTNSPVTNFAYIEYLNTGQTGLSWAQIFNVGGPYNLIDLTYVSFKITGTKKQFNTGKKINFKFSGFPTPLDQYFLVYKTEQDDYYMMDYNNVPTRRVYLENRIHMLNGLDSFDDIEMFQFTDPLNNKIYKLSTEVQWVSNTEVNVIVRDSLFELYDKTSIVDISILKFIKY